MKTQRFVQGAASLYSGQVAHKIASIMTDAVLIECLVFLSAWETVYADPLIDDQDGGSDTSSHLIAANEMAKRCEAVKEI